MRKFGFVAAAVGAGAVLGAASGVQASVTFYTTAAAFNAAAPGATDPTGMSAVTSQEQAYTLMEAAPSVWRRDGAHDQDPMTLGDLTFFAKGGVNNSQGFFSGGAPGITGWTYSIGNPQNDSYTVDIAGGAYAFGFKVWEPDGRECIVPCVSSSFTLTAFDAANNTLGSLLYVPGFSTIFMGVTSTTAIARIAVDENYYGRIQDFHCCLYDNEYFGDYEMVSARAVAAGVPEPATWGLMLSGVFGAGALLRRRRRAAFA